MHTAVHEPETSVESERISEIFRCQGYYIARGLLSPEEVAEIRDAFMHENRNGPVPGLSDILKDARADDPLAFYPRMMHPHCHPDRPVGPLAERYLLDCRIERILFACMGEQPIAVQSMFYFKPPGARGQTFHQDNYYLRVKPRTCCAAWIAIDDADAENGGMSVVPGTQDMEVVCPEAADPSTSFTGDYVKVPEGMKPVLCELRAGDVLFFNGSLVHGSTPNSSKTRFRRSLINHYVPEGTTEMSHWYHGAIRTFDRSERKMGIASGGGPCGTATARH
jgi:ectoine hydroxylase-related dioxygenase (phytanoyl-CoA dioxygenase family)